MSLKNILSAADMLQPSGLQGTKHDLNKNLHFSTTPLERFYPFQSDSNSSLTLYKRPALGF